MIHLLLIPILLVATPPSAPPKLSKSDGNRTHFIEVQGNGNTSEEALKDAFRAAVRQAVGVYVDEDTCVENDEVIKDQVLTHSKGCIESYEKVSEKSERDVICVTIRAVVKTDEVTNYLRKASIEITNLPGDQFWAKVSSQRREDVEAEALLRKTLDGLPEKFLKAEVIGKPKIDHDENITRLAVTVRVAVDGTAYQIYSKELQGVLEQIAKRNSKIRPVTVFQTQPNSQPPSTSTSWEKLALTILGVDQSSTNKYPPSQKGKKSPSLKDVKKSHSPQSGKKPATQPKYSLEDDVGEDIVVAVNTQVTKSGEQLRWKCYVLDKRLRPLLADVASRVVTCRVMLLDSSEKEVAAADANQVNIDSRTKTKTKTKAKMFSVTPVVALSGHSARSLQNSSNALPGEIKIVLVSQVFFCNSSSSFHFAQLPEIMYNCVFDLGDAELKTVENIRSKLSSSQVLGKRHHPVGNGSGMF